MDHHSFKNILVIKHRALGDAVISLSSIQYLKEVFPSAKIYYAVPLWIMPFFKNIRLDRVEIIPIKLNKLKDFFRFFQTCSRLDLDCIFELQQRGTTRNFFSIFSKIKRIKYFYHNHHIKKPGFVLNQGLNKPIIQRDLDGVWSGINHLMPNSYPVPHFLDYKIQLPFSSVVTRENAIVIGVVATRQTKMWPLKNYGELIKLILDNKFAEKVVIPLSNSEQDQEIENKLIGMSLPDRASVIKVPLDQLPLELAKCKLYIGNDTGLKHICIGLNLKTYTFFGPEPPKEWHPYDTVLHKYFYLDNLACRTEKKHYCGLHNCDSMACLKHFSPNEVFQLICNENP